MDPAFLLGMVLGEAVDPLVAAIGFLVGFAATRWWIRVLGSCAFGTVISAVAAYTDPIAPEYHNWTALTVANVGATLLWASVGWAASMAKRKLTKRQSSSGST